MSFDNTDLKILSELHEDSNRPVRLIAEKLKMHPNTLLQRIKRLENDGIVKGYRAELDFVKLGLQVHAFIMIRVKKSGLQDRKPLEEIASFPEVTCLYETTGTNDCIAAVRAKNMDEMVAILRRIQNQKAVTRTATSFVLVKYKDEIKYDPFKL